jgi:outer membrane protein assembly factor BamB
VELFAVIPLLTTAGTALLPVIMAAIASLAAVVLKPRELFRLCRERPATAGGWGGVITLGILGVVWFLTADNSARGVLLATSRPQGHVDWAHVAEELIARERAGKAPTSLTEELPAGAPLVLGHDCSRCFYGGGASPVRLTSRWSFHPEDTMFLSSPAVTGKRIFAAGCQSEMGSYVGLLACLDAETGQPLWQTTQVGDEPLRPFFSSPALTQDGKCLVIGQGLHSDRDCSLLGFDTATGRCRWAVKTTLHIESSPAIFGRLAVVGAGAIEGHDGKPVGDPGYVLAVRIADGHELWRYPVNDPESSPAIDEHGTVYIGSGFNGMAVVALRSDETEDLQARKLERVLWRTPLTQPVTSAITLAGDLVIAGAGNSDMVHSNPDARGLVVALDSATGALRWQTPFDDAVLGPIAARGGLLICPSRTGEVTALAAHDGHVLWRARISRNAPVLAGCSLTDRGVYAVSSDGYLAVLDLKTGNVQEKVYLNDQRQPGTGLSISSPYVARGRLIVGSETGGLCCLVGSEATE